MRSQSLSYIVHTFSIGLRLRCPNCNQGRLFQRGFHMHETCPYCDVRFTRGSGDTVGSVYINLALAELTAVIGFFTLHTLIDMPILHQLFIWIPYVLVFTLAFYRQSRGLWVVIVYLTGGLYPDPDYTREYINPNSHYIPADRTTHEPE
jgi:uncharacterized protein (DUF983 family)